MKTIFGYMRIQL